MQALSNVDWSKMTKETREYLKATGLARAQLGYSKEMQELDNMALPVVFSRHKELLNCLTLKLRPFLISILTSNNKLI